MAGFLLAVFIVATFSSYAISIDSQSTDKKEPAASDNLVNTVETALIKSTDISLEELLAAEQLIQEQIMQKLTEQITGITPQPPICNSLLNARDHWSGLADIYRDKANEHDLPAWKSLCNAIANRCDLYANFFQMIFDAYCTD